MKKIMTFKEFINKLEKEESIDKNTIDSIKKVSLEENIKDDYTINKQHPLDHDVWIYRLLIVALLLVILAVLGAYVYNISKNNCEIPSGLIAIGATSVGALAGIISMSNKKQ